MAAMACCREGRAAELAFSYESAPSLKATGCIVKGYSRCHCGHRWITHHAFYDGKTRRASQFRRASAHFVLTLRRLILGTLQRGWVMMHSLSLSGSWAHIRHGQLAKSVPPQAQGQLGCPDMMERVTI